MAIRCRNPEINLPAAGRFRAGRSGKSALHSPRTCLRQAGLLRQPAGEAGGLSANFRNPNSTRPNHRK